jgi:hypothetical protein
MRHRHLWFFATAALILSSVGTPGQNASKAAALPSAIPMPQDRSADSYRIYSKLVPLGETAGEGWPHDLWLIRDTTEAPVPSDEPCAPTRGSACSESFASSMNPHAAVHPTADRSQDFAEILEDFDRHCHDRVMLEANNLTLSAPVRLLNREEQEEFVQSRNKRPAERSAEAAKFAGAPALYGFSEVYFNHAHTVALVYATHWCGGLCGQGMWLAFALSNGQWKALRWNATTWIS